MTQQLDAATCRKFVLKCIDAGFVIHREVGVLNPYGDAKTVLDTLTAELLALACPPVPGEVREAAAKLRCEEPCLEGCECNLCTVVAFILSARGAGDGNESSPCFRRSHPMRDLTNEELDRLAALAEKAKKSKTEFESYAEELIAMRSKTDFIAACDPDTIRSLIAMARRGIPEPPADIKAVMIARHNRVRVSEDDATAVVDWLTPFFIPEPQ